MTLPFHGGDENSIFSWTTKFFPLTGATVSSKLCVFFKFRRDDVIASHSGLKIRWSKDREGWSPSRATTFAAMRTVFEIDVV